MTALVKEVSTIDGFHQLETKKQQQILDAVCFEFAKKGYNLASTNEMVKQAQISKGTLFNYFGTKQKLYQYLVQKVLDMLDEMMEQMNTKEPDLLNHYYHLANIEMKYYHRYPALFTFMGTLNKNPMDLLETEMIQRVSSTLIRFQQLVNNIDHIDRTLFHTNDVDNTVKIIQYALKGYEQKLTKKMMGMDITEADFEQEMELFKQFLHTLRQQFYRRSQA